MNTPALSSSSLLEKYQRLLVVTFVSMLTLLLAFISGLVIRQQSALLEKGLLQRGAATLQHLADPAQQAIEARNNAALSDLVRIVKMTDDDIESVIILSSNGRILAASDPGATVPIEGLQVRSVVNTRDYHVGESLAFVSPLQGPNGSVLGASYLQLSRSPIRRAALLAAAELDAAVFAVFLVIGFLLDRLLSKARKLAVQEGEKSKALAKAYDDLRVLQSQFIQAEKMSAVGQLAAGISHEINNPLATILGFSQSVAARLSPTDPLASPINSIVREALRCKTLVKDLLVFSRKAKEIDEPVDINKAVDVVCTLIRAEARTRKADIRLELDPRLPRIIADSNQIAQVLINLANNAFDAMPGGGILAIKTSLERENEQDAVCLRVIDTGTGIPPEIVPRIFEPFFTTKPIGEGTGLGLSLVYEIVKKFHGYVDVSSRPGHTAFRLRFPALLSEGEAEIRENKQSPADQTRPSRLPVVAFLFLFFAASGNVTAQETLRLPDFTGVTSWLNAPVPLTPNALRGKVVLVDFWTYSCINCIRLIPALNLWYGNYHPTGLEIVGVHTPEFSFEKDKNNVAEAIKKFHISFPVALDDNYRVWDSFHNRAWPAEYLIDVNGVVRASYFGEGHEVEMEKRIKELLAEASRTNGNTQVGHAKRVDLSKVKTQEMTLGFDNFSGNDNPEPLLPHEIQEYHAPKAPRLGTFCFVGRWRLQREFAESMDPGDALLVNFDANKANLVAGGAQNHETLVEILIDGKVPSPANKGDDVFFKNGKAFCRITWPRLYNLYKGSSGRHKLEIRVRGADFNAYTFTFG